MPLRKTLALLVLLTGCNLRVGDPKKADPSGEVAKAEKASNVLKDVAAMGKAEIQTDDLGPSWAGINSEDLKNMTPAPIAVLKECILDHRTVGGATTDDLDAFGNSKLFIRNDRAFTFNFTMVAATASKADQLAKLAGDNAVWVQCMAKHTADKSTFKIEPDSDPKVTIFSFKSTYKVADVAVPYNGRVITMQRNRSIVLMVSAQPSTSGLPDGRRLASILWERMAPAKP